MYGIQGLRLWEVARAVQLFGLTTKNPDFGSNLLPKARGGACSAASLVFSRRMSDDWAPDPRTSFLFSRAWP
jgi:hypothetical protein